MGLGYSSGVGIIWGVVIIRAIRESPLHLGGWVYFGRFVNRPYILGGWGVFRAIRESPLHYVKTQHIRSSFKLREKFKRKQVRGRASADLFYVREIEFFSRFFCFMFERLSFSLGFFCFGSIATPCFFCFGSIATPLVVLL